MPLNSDKILGDLINKQQKIIDQLTEMVKLLGSVNAEISKAGGIKDLSKSTKKLNEVTSKFNDNQNKLVRNTKILTDIQKTKAKQTDLETTSGKKLLLEQRKLSKARADASKAIDKQIGRQNRLTKSFQNAIVKVALMAGGLHMILRGFGNMIKSSVNFNKQMLKVRAIVIDTTLSTEEQSRQFEKLKKNAKELGRETSKTAEQIGKLHEEFGKLGFSTREIIKATRATVILSEVTQSELAESAKVAASTIRGFRLNASETQRVVDVMAKSFSSSGLDMQKFASSMANAQIAAKSTGKTLEQTTAMLGTIIDTGTDASKAGTDLRVIFGKLAKAGISLNEAYDMVNSSGNKVVTAMGLVDDRAYSSLITLAENKDKVDELTGAYEGAAGAAQAMADIMKDELTYEIELAKSAWDGFVKTIDDGEGTITKSIRGVVRMFASLSTWLTNINTSAKDKALAETFEEAEKSANEFFASLEGEEGIMKIELLQQKISDLNKENFALAKEYSDKNKKRDIENFNTKSALIENEKDLLLDFIDEIKEAEKEKGKKIIEVNKVLTEEEKKELEKQEKAFYKKVDAIVKKWEDAQKFIKPIQIVDEEELDAELEYAINTYNETIEGQKQLLLTQLNSGLIAKQEYAEQIKAIDDEIAENERDEAEKTFQEKIEKLEFYKTKIQDIGNTTFDFISALNDREIEETKRKIDNKEISEKQGAIEIAKINRKQDILNKASAIFNIALNTAMAVAKVWGQTGIAGIIAQVAPIAMGAIQIATVLSKKPPEIPSYFKGSDGKKVSGLAEVHGKEKIDTKDGAFYTNWNKYEGKIIDLPESTITSYKDIIQSDLNNIVQQGNAIDFNGGISKDEFEKIMDDNAKKLDKSIRNMPRDIYQGLTKQGVIEGNNINTYRDRRFRHVGR